MLAIRGKPYVGRNLQAVNPRGMRQCCAASIRHRGKMIAVSS
jgi:hypothetical protein